MSEEESAGQRPLLRVVRGNPDDEELAALTTVVAGLAARPGEPEQNTRRSLWSDPAHRLGVSPRPGVGAWKASALPR